MLTGTTGSVLNRPEAPRSGGTGIRATFKGSRSLGGRATRLGAAGAAGVCGVGASAGRGCLDPAWAAWLSPDPGLQGMAGSSATECVLSGLSRLVSLV